MGKAERNKPDPDKIYPSPFESMCQRAPGAGIILLLRGLFELMEHPGKAITDVRRAISTVITSRSSAQK